MISAGPSAGKAMKIGVAKESVSDERRVALVPDSVAALKKLGIDALIESGAGAGAFFSDADYQKAGAQIFADRKALRDSDMIAQVQRPSAELIAFMREGAISVSFLPPYSSLEIIRKLAERKVTAFSMDLIPRISR